MKKAYKYWDRAWSLVEGCTPCSPGCAHCWSAAIASRFQKASNFKTTEAGLYNDHVRFRLDRLILPDLAYRPSVWAIWTDLFHDEVHLDYITLAFRYMLENPRHIFLVLTKRANRAFDFLQSYAHKGIVPNAWIGVTVCNQAEADEKIPLLLQTPAAYRFLSVEPMLGPIDICSALWTINYKTGQFKPIDLVICGPENGPGKRPFDLAWAAKIEADCQAANVPFFFKGEGLSHDLPWEVRR